MTQNEDAVSGDTSGTAQAEPASLSTGFRNRLHALWQRKWFRLAAKFVLTGMPCPLFIIEGWDDVWLQPFLLGMPLGLILALVASPMYGLIGRPGIGGGIISLCIFLLIYLLTTALIGLGFAGPYGFLYAPIYLVMFGVQSDFGPAFLVAASVAIHWTELGWVNKSGG